MEELYLVIVEDLSVPTINHYWFTNYDRARSLFLDEAAKLGFKETVFTFPESYDEALMSDGCTFKDLKRKALVSIRRIA